MRHALRKQLRHVVALVGLIALASVVGGYILDHQRLRFPLVEERPYRLYADLSDAQAVQPGQGQTIRIAGVSVGHIGEVSLEDGAAVVELQIEPQYKGLIREDATALLRSKTLLKDMFLEVDPGEGRALAEDGHIALAGTAPDVDPDEILAALDRDSRDYLRLLVSGAGKGLSGRGADLRETLARLGPLHRDLAAVTTAAAKRRHNLRRLVRDYGLLVELLGRKDDELTQLVSASDEALGAFAAEHVNLSGAVARLPRTLREAQSALGKLDGLSQQLGPTLEALTPSVRQLDQTNAELLPFARETAPILREQLRPFARAATPFIEHLGGAADGLGRAAPDLTTSVHQLNRLFNIGAYNPGGAESLTGNLDTDRARSEGYLYWLAWLSQNTTGLFNVEDAHGPLRRLTLGGLNCALFRSVGAQAGLVPGQVDLAADLFAGIGACSK